jgi:hypothetical protein
MALIAEELPGHWTPHGVQAAVDKYVLGKGRAGKAVDIGVTAEEMQVGGGCWDGTGCRSSGSGVDAACIWCSHNSCSPSKAGAIASSLLRCNPQPDTEPKTVKNPKPQAAYNQHKSDEDWLFLVGQELGLDVPARVLLRALQGAGVVAGPGGRPARARVPKALLQQLHDRCVVCGGERWEAWCCMLSLCFGLNPAVRLRCCRSICTAGAALAARCWLLYLLPTAGQQPCQHLCLPRHPLTHALMQPVKSYNPYGARPGLPAGCTLLLLQGCYVLPWPQVQGGAGVAQPHRHALPRGPGGGTGGAPAAAPRHHREAAQGRAGGCRGGAAQGAVREVGRSRVCCGEVVQAGSVAAGFTASGASRGATGPSTQAPLHHIHHNHHNHHNHHIHHILHIHHNHHNDRPYCPAMR